MGLFDKSSSSSKRHLSDQSNNGDEPKRHREEGSQTDSNSCWDDIFLVGLEESESNSPVLKFLKRLDVQINELFSSAEVTQNSQIKGEQHLNQVSESMDLINEKFETFKKELEEKDKKISILENNVSMLSTTVDVLSKQLDRQEQYSRRNCLLIHNIPENKDENTDDTVIKIIGEKVGEPVCLEDLDRTHRLGPPKTNKNRPIIVKFSRYHTRNRVFKKKKQLKGHQMSITESLTKRRMGELNDARNQHGFENVWTSDGKILFKDSVENKVKVYYD